MKNNNFIVKKDPVVLIMAPSGRGIPDYQQVIPAQTKRLIRMREVKFWRPSSASPFSRSEKTKGVNSISPQICWSFPPTHPDFGEAKEEFFRGIQGEEITVGFNYPLCSGSLEYPDQRGDPL